MINFTNMKFLELMKLHWDLSWFIFNNYALQIIFFIFILFALVVVFNKYFDN